MKVMKFGGASLRDKQTVLTTARTIIEQKGDRAVVLSALFGITDFLEKAIDLARQNEANIKTSIDEFRHRHHIVASQCIEEINILKATLRHVDERIEKLERLLYGVAYTEEITKKVNALILSFGERLAVVIMAGILQSQGCQSEFMESDKIGVISDNSYDNASAILPLVKDNLQKNVIPKIKDKIIPIITGFFGRNQEGKVTLFGRNSSDYSAAVIAHGLQATCLEIWKDVDGFMSADPKLVANAFLIEHLSYEEAAELSYFGAKILHPRTVEPLRPHLTPIIIRNLHNPQNTGTEIGPEARHLESIIKSVTYNKQISVLKVRGAGVGYKPGVISEIGSLLGNLGINIYSIITSQTCINLLIDRKDSAASYQALLSLGEGVIDTIDHQDDQVVVAVVGTGLDYTPGLAAKVFQAVANEGVNIEMISSGASLVATYFIVKDSYLSTAVNAVHRAFFD